MRLAGEGPAARPASRLRLVRAREAHEPPADLSPLLLAPGEVVEVGARSSAWPAFVLVIAAHGSGWVPARHLSAAAGQAVVQEAYDTTELAIRPGEELEVLVEDQLGGWVWCRSISGAEGWVPAQSVETAEPERDG